MLLTLERPMEMLFKKMPLLRYRSHTMQIIPAICKNLLLLVYSD